MDTCRSPLPANIGKGGTFYGITVVPPAEYTAVVKTINELGWRATTHAVGDAAIDEVLDAYEAADAEHPIVGKRWAIEHAFVSRPDQLSRMKKLGLILSVQDHLYLAAPALKNYLGPARGERGDAGQDLSRRGFPGGRRHRFAGRAVQPILRDSITSSPATRFPTASTVPTSGSRRASELLRMITINYAKLTGEADIKGSIEPGKLADFAVLSEDVLIVPEAKIPRDHRLAHLRGRPRSFPRRGDAVTRVAFRTLGWAGRGAGKVIPDAALRPAGNLLYACRSRPSPVSRDRHREWERKPP